MCWSNKLIQVVVAFWLAWPGNLCQATETQPTGRGQAPPPNIILVMADDLGWSDLGCYGGEIDTPHIDALAAAGLRFTQFYNNSICGPTRASLLTGLYCQQVGHRGDRWNDPKDFQKCVTIGEVLQRAGYHTAIVGKWQGRDSALDRGFDRFFGPMCQGKISYFHEVVQNPYFLDRQRWEVPDDFYMTDAFSDYAEQFLQEALRGEAPFFLYVAHIAPHWPLHARERDIRKYRQRYRDRGWDAWRTQRFAQQRNLGLAPPAWQLAPRPPSVHAWEADKHPAWQAERMATYAAQVESIDRGLGRLMKLVDDAGQRDNTLVIFLSDNGAAPDGGTRPSASKFGFAAPEQQKRWRLDGVPIQGGSGPENLPGPADTFAAYGLGWATLSNCPLRGTKLTGYEGGIRTPCIVRWPATIKEGGQLTDQIGHVIDFMATFLDVADASYPTALGNRNPLPMEGKSLLPVFQGKQRKGHEMLAWDTPRDHAIRRGQWKAIRSRGSQVWQLFDLEQDATETTNLAASAPEVVQSLSRDFERWQQHVNRKK